MRKKNVRKACPLAEQKPNDFFFFVIILDSALSFLRIWVYPYTGHDSFCGFIRTKECSKKNSTFINNVTFTTLIDLLLNLAFSRGEIPRKIY
jgi:hypothetical protein